MCVCCWLSRSWANDDLQVSLSKMEVRGNHFLTQQSSTYGHLLPQLVNFEEKFNWNYFCTVISQTRFSHCFLYAWINKFFLTKYRLPVWKFQNFYVKSFEFWFWAIEVKPEWQQDNFLTPKMAKTAFLEVLEPPKLISRKIWGLENCTATIQVLLQNSKLLT